MWADLLATVFGLYMRYMEECRGNSGTTYVTETIHSSFQLLTITFFSHKASHYPRTPHTHDRINVQEFPWSSAFPVTSSHETIHRSIQVRATLRRLTWEPLVRLSCILNSRAFPQLYPTISFFFADLTRINLYHSIILDLDSYFMPPSRL